MKEQIKQLSKHRNRIISSLILLVIMICGITYAWFYRVRSLYTYAYVESPSTLAIKGPNETTVEQIDLSTVDLTNGDHEANFVFCVAGNEISNYKMELAYTTNIPFTYTIYPTSQTTSQEEAGADALIYLDGKTNTAYYYPRSESALVGDFVNRDGVTASRDKHEYAYDTYGNDKVQINAEPLYYLVKDIVPKTSSGSSSFVDYYILNLNWTDEVATTYVKETDLVYLLVSNQ